MTLEEFFSQNPSAAIAFSGGTDSAYLLYAALRCGADVTAYYVKTPFQPQFEYEDAKHLAKELNVPLKTVFINILASDAIVCNPADRCYHCKATLFTELKKQASSDGYELILDGTNFSDDISDRPGFRALQELGVRSPLRECGLTKAEIRRLSREAGLFTADKPAYACLATRIPTGCSITCELLSKIEAAESALAELGFSGFRVRTDGSSARLELQKDQFYLFFSRYNDVSAALSLYFEAITLDLKPRRKDD